MASASPRLSALEKAEKEKAKNDAALEELGKEIKEVEARIRALLEPPQSHRDEGKLSFEKETLAGLRKDKAALLEKDKAVAASIARLCELEAQQVAELVDSDDLLKTALPNWDAPLTVVQLQVPKALARLCGMVQRSQIAFATRENCRETVAELSSLLEAVERTASQVTIVKGCPGSGKTLFLWAFSLYGLINLNRSVLFVLSDNAILYLDALSKCIQIIADGEQEVATPATFHKEYKAIMGCLRVDLLVIDGVKYSNINEWIIETNKVPCRLRVFSSSVGATPDQQVLQGLGTIVARSFMWPSWSLSEYKAVLPQQLDAAFTEKLGGPILDAIRAVCAMETDPARLDDNAFRNDVIAKKYYFAGGSARYFFDCSIADIQLSVSNLITNVSDFKALLRPVGGVATDNYPHGLVQRFWLQGALETNLLVSQYAHREILTAMLRRREDPIQFSQEFARIAETLENPAVLGWALEEKYNARLRACASGPPYPAQLELYVRTLTPQASPTARRQQFDIPKGAHVTFDPRPDQPCTFADLFAATSLVWLHPKEWNQACYDFAMIKGERGAQLEGTNCVDLFTFQCTRSNDHSVKPDYLAQLIDWLVRHMRVQVKTLTHIALTETANFASFSFDPVSSPRLRLYTEGPGAMKYCTSVAICSDI